MMEKALLREIPDHDNLDAEEEAARISLMKVQKKKQRRDAVAKHPAPITQVSDGRWRTRET